MTEYRRLWVPGGTWFFTVNLAQRGGNRLLVGARLDSTEGVRGLTASYELLSGPGSRASSER
jgi:hypothetical protein